MPKAFDATSPPFDRLTEAEVGQVRSALDIEYFRPGAVLVAQGARAENLYIVIKGEVEERDGRELQALLGPRDWFDSRALVQDASPHAFVAREETLCYLLPRDVTLALMRTNARFGACFFLDISRKLDALAQEEETLRSGALMRARVADLPLQPATFIDAADTIESAGRRMHEAHANALLVRDGGRTGIVTGMNLARAVVLDRIPVERGVGAIARYELVTVAPEDFVSSAMLLMTRHNKRRLVVRQGERWLGTIEDIDLLGFIAGDAQMVAARIERAESVEELAPAVRRIGEQVRLLRKQGVNVDVIAELVTDLNRRLFAKLHALLAPASLRDGACLVVMGSEGRGEQTLRTDQDNGLILARAVADEEGLVRFRELFSATLEGFGFERCAGGVMLSNPQWCRTLADYHAQLRRWVALPEADSHLNVAILYDARAVAGDGALLDEVRAGLVEMVRDHHAYLSHFAKSIDSFETPIGLFNNLLTPAGSGDALDLKKGGIFPVVHGVRSLALEAGITETGTVRRIGLLADGGPLSPEYGRELTDAFLFLQRLRLDAQLEHAGGGALVRPGELTSMERDLLRDAFRIVKRLRELVRHRFHLGAF